MYMTKNAENRRSIQVKGFQDGNIRGFIAKIMYQAGRAMEVAIVAPVSRTLNYLRTTVPTKWMSLIPLTAGKQSHCFSELAASKANAHTHQAGIAYNVPV